MGTESGTVLYHFRKDPAAADRYPSLFRYRKVHKKSWEDTAALEETDTAAASSDQSTIA